MHRFLLTLCLLATAVACQPSPQEEEPAFEIGIAEGGLAVEPEPDILLVQPTSAAPALLTPDGSLSTATPAKRPAANSSGAMPAPIIVPTQMPTAVPPPAATPLPVQLEVGRTLYRVVDVAASDTLNIRNGPGISHPIIGQLPANAQGINITAVGEVVGSSLWVPISASGLVGWVNSTFLAEMSPSAASFCENPTAVAHLIALKDSLEAQDGNALTELIHPDGLRVGLSWWNPQLDIAPEAIATLFESTTSYDWGMAGGSGLSLNGTFADRALPLLQRDLLAENTAQACNDILYGATAGLIQLPIAYENTPFYAVYRPAPAEDASGYNWGSWVIGFEEADGVYYIRYLIHYQYEI